jgi:CubicO group peptidase (beta-lactamase class C family)
MPEEIGIRSDDLRTIDSLAQEGIAARAYPGCQILLAKNGRIFYEKAFGHPRYGDTVNLSTDQLFDIASVTKVAATTLAIMKLYDKGKIALTDSLGKYLSFLKGSNKSSLKIGDVMSHEAGLQDWIPFYKETMVNSKPDPAIYQAIKSAEFPTEVAYELYIRSDFQKTILQNITDSPLRANRNYKYSDLGFYLLKLVVENISGQPFDQYLDETFYKPLGLAVTTFNPLNKFPKDRLIPTEYDNNFRNQLIWGYVHDPGAAMLGGISGHAGLFSNVRDLAVIMQMLVNNGSYGGKEYLTPATVKKFTQTWDINSGNRRGVGFDKPLKNFDENGPACKGASPLSFGHSGFTGTYIWADPENELIYIFLSNRIYPDAGNQKLSSMNIRTNIHQAAYDLLRKSKIK